MLKRTICLIIAVFLFQSASLAAEVLPLDRFITTAIQNNPSYQISAHDYLIALESDKSARSLEDWNLIASGVWNEATPAPLSPFSAQYQKTMGYSIGLKKYIAQTGTDIKLEHSNTRINAEYPPPVTIPGIGTIDFNPPAAYYLSNLSLTISQPLLRNAFGLARKNSLKISDNSLKLAEIKLSEDWEDFIARLRGEYLTWQKCHRNVNLFEEKVKTVQDQLKLVQKQVKYGLSEQLDLVQIEQKLRAYQIMLEQAKLACDNQTQNIQLLMAEKDTGAAIVPQKFVKNGPVMEAGEALAYLEDRSNVKRTADIMVSIQGLNLETKKDGELIDAKLVLAAKPNAFAEKFSDSLSGIGNYNEYTVSVNASRPLANDKAKAEADKAGNEYARALRQREDILLKARTGLSSLYTSLKYLDRMLELSQGNLKLARQRLALEKKKFQQGRSSVFFVLQAEDDVLAAENSLNETLFARENIINQVQAFTDRYAIEYKEVLEL